jgi:hypothetical protein
MPKIPKLPKLLDSKIYKTGQTRGADDDVIFQNRVGRNSTVLISYLNWDSSKTAPDNDGIFENGYIVLISPEDFFEKAHFEDELAAKGLKIGENALLFYETRLQWNLFNPEKKDLTFATSRQEPLGGEYVARVPSNTSEAAEKIILGYNTSKLKGAGIRVYEYASNKIIIECRVQLELLFWHCENSKMVAKYSGMTDEDIEIRIESNAKFAEQLKLDDWARLKESRIWTIMVTQYVHCV